MLFPWELDWLIDDIDVEVTLTAALDSDRIIVFGTLGDGVCITGFFPVKRRLYSY
jgi:hypothetical protein